MVFCIGIEENLFTKNVMPTTASNKNGKNLSNGFLFF